MPEPLDIDYLKPFIESTVAAAARFRRVLIIMITASILAFGAFWNSLDGTWFNSRIKAARHGEAYLIVGDIRARLTEIEESLGQMGDKGRQEVEEKKLKLEQEKQRLLTNAETILQEHFKERFNERIKEIPKITGAKQLEEELEHKSYNTARHWISQRMIPNKEQAAQYAQKLEENRTGNILLIHIPFFGTVFDVNALGLWGGATFTVILLVFRFSLWREYNNLRLTFNEAKPEHLRFCYMSLAMQQVLTVPPALYKDEPALTQSEPALKPQGRVVQWLYFPPLLIQLAIIINDCLTNDVGGIFNLDLAQISTGVSLVFFVIIVILTVRCLDLSIAIDRVWAAADEGIEKIQAGLSKDFRKPPPHPAE